MTVQGRPPEGALRYYDIEKHWSIVGSHVLEPEPQRVLRRDFHKFLMDRWDKPFLPGEFPADHEACDWRDGRREELGLGPEGVLRDDWEDEDRDDQPGPDDFTPGPPDPLYWAYVKHSACHALVNFALATAKLARPDQPWRIVTSDAHSTVWNGKVLLFDFQFQAMGIPASECWDLASADGRELAVGKYRRIYHFEHWTAEAGRGR